MLFISTGREVGSPCALLLKVFNYHTLKGIFLLFDSWEQKVVGEGTLFSMWQNSLESSGSDWIESGLENGLRYTTT